MQRMCAVQQQAVLHKISSLGIHYTKQNKTKQKKKKKKKKKKKTETLHTTVFYLSSLNVVDRT